MKRIELASTNIYLGKAASFLEEAGRNNSVAVISEWAGEPERELLLRLSEIAVKLLLISPSEWQQRKLIYLILEYA